MDLSANLHITQKGADEIKHREHKLGMKKRSVLILLDTPKSLAQIIDKSVFPELEVREDINALIGEGFISASGAAGAPHSVAPHSLAPHAEAPRPAAAPAVAPAVGGIAVDDEIVISEAKFLLTDFAVDTFGTQSQAVVDAIRACKSVNDFRVCLNALWALVEQKFPARSPTLRKLIEEINATA